VHTLGRAVAIACGISLFSATAHAQTIRIAAASDLQAALPSLAERFERETSKRIAVTFGSSGNFASQIRNGAPFDLFFSADVDYPRQLADSGLADAGSLYVYAVGRLAVWTRADSGVDVVKGLRALVDSRVRRVAIANPEHAPYGRAAIAALRHEGIYEAIRGRLVLGENVSQAAQFVESGNAEAGIIALSLALASPLRGRGIYYEIPASYHPPLEQAAVVLSHSVQSAAARQFLAFMQRDDVVGIMQTFGFTTPSASRPR